MHSNNLLKAQQHKSALMRLTEGFQSGNKAAEEAKANMFREKEVSASSHSK